MGERVGERVDMGTIRWCVSERVGGRIEWWMK